MCIPPEADPLSPHFALLHAFAWRNGLNLLSMGMSADYLGRPSSSERPTCASGARSSGPGPERAPSGRRPRARRSVRGGRRRAAADDLDLGPRSDPFEQPPDLRALRRHAAGGRREAGPGEVEEDGAAAAADVGPRFQPISITRSERRSCATSLSWLAGQGGDEAVVAAVPGVAVRVAERPERQAGPGPGAAIGPVEDLDQSKGRPARPVASRFARAVLDRPRAQERPGCRPRAGPGGGRAAKGRRGRHR